MLSCGIRRHSSRSEVYPLRELTLNAPPLVARSNLWWESIDLSRTYPGLCAHFPTQLSQALPTFVYSPALGCGLFLLYQDKMV